jgi:sugar (pentulose or hexulose) kinase
MGGREFEALLDGSLPDRAEVSWIEEIITQDILAVPGFSHQGGAFRQHRGYFVPERPGSVELRFALASLYSALMIDLQLDWLGSSQSIFLEGSFCKNPFIPGLLAALRPTQTVRVAEESSGTTQGAFLLANWGVEHPTPGKAVPPINCSSLAEYRRHWRERTEEVL